MDRRQARVTTSGGFDLGPFPLTREQAAESYGQPIPPKAWDDIELAWDRYRAMTPYRDAPKDSRNRNDPDRYEAMHKRTLDRLTKAADALNRPDGARRAEILLCETVSDPAALIAIQGTLDATIGGSPDSDIAARLEGVWRSVVAQLRGHEVAPAADLRKSLDAIIEDVAAAKTPHSESVSDPHFRNTLIRRIWRAMDAAGLEPTLSHVRDGEMSYSQLSHFERLIHDAGLCDLSSGRPSIKRDTDCLKGDASIIFRAVTGQR